MNLGIQTPSRWPTPGPLLAGEPDSVLDDYSEARRPIAQQVVEMTEPANAIGDATAGRSSGAQCIHL